MCGFIAQLVEHRTGIAEVTGSNPVEALIFFRLLLSNSPRSIYQYSNMAPRLSGQNCKFFKFLLSLNSQRRLGYKENNTKYGSLS